MKLDSWDIIPTPVTPKINAKALFLTNDETKTTAVDTEILDVAFSIFFIKYN